ncbi:MAG: hypothetical protein ACXV4B_09350 [Halobacteriota archaeon]
MAEKFDPAPFDKYAPDPKEAVKADRNVDEQLRAGIVGGSFPASDLLVPRNHHLRSMMKGGNDKHYEFAFFNRQSYRLDSRQHPTIS